MGLEFYLAMAHLSMIFNFKHVIRKSGVAGSSMIGFPLVIANSGINMPWGKELNTESALTVYKELGVAHLYKGADGMLSL